MENKLKTIIFDLDGVLIDACEWHYGALNKALKKCSLKPIGRNDHLKKYNGLPTATKLEMMSINEENSRKVRELKKKYTAEIIAKECKPDNEKIEMLHSLKNYTLACCSNAIKESIVDMLTKSNMINYFDLVIGNDEIKNPKPDPEIYLKAFEILKVKPEECLIIEDAPYGIEAAKASGAIVIAVKGHKDVNLDLFRRLNCNLR